VGPSSRSPRRLAAAVALAAFVLVAAAGLLTAREPRLPMPAERAVRLGAADPSLRGTLHPGDRARASYVDDQMVKVMWYRGGRAVATAGVRVDGAVPHAGPVPAYAGWGAGISHRLAVLGGLTALFLLATLRLPLRAPRTLDTLALAALVVPASLIDRGRFGPAEGIAAALLLYLGARGAWLAARRPRADRDDAASTPAPVLLTAAAARLNLPRLPAQVTFGVLVATVLVTLTSTGIVDIAVADMEGATLLTHGTLPYGHMPGDIVHGDTYGLPIYLFYAPFAALWPMADGWADASGALVANVLVLLACLAGAGAATRGARWPAVLALLAFPAALMSTSSGTNDVLIAALLVWAFAWWTRPAASSALLMLAGVAKLAPLAIVPLWLARLRGAALWRALAACAAVGLVSLAALVALGGLGAPRAMAEAMAFQLGRRSELSVWTALGLQPLQPLAKALVIAAVAGGTVLVWGDRNVAADPRRVAGLVVAVLAALQLSANRWAPMYLLWLAPPALVALLGPAASQPAAARADEEATVAAAAELAPA
jgi:hypothetical protein